MVAIAGFSKDQIFTAVRQMYTDVARSPSWQFHFPTGREACRFVGYSDEMLAGLPETAIESFAGVGCPFRADVIRPSDIVLDIGAGSGTDTLIAAKQVGPQGRVYAIDLTPAMLRKLRQTLDASGITNVEGIEGNAEAIPLPDASVDVVTSNGVLNLVPDKTQAIAEIFRVLRPGGRVQIADIAVSRPVGKSARGDPKLWAECVVGAAIEEDYLDLFRAAGFTDLSVLRRYDYFAGSASHDTRRIAGALGGKAVELTMRRPEFTQAVAPAYVRRFMPLALGRRAAQHGFAGVLAAGAAIIACYGVLALVALLGAFGFAMPLNNLAWASLIVIFAALVPVGLTLNMCVHRAIGPVVLGFTGALLVGYSMFGRYDWKIEAAGFAALIGATVWDRRQFRLAIGC
jgi:arsenite methyltransferase